MAKSRPPVPASTQTTVLLANRHACCVCQKPRVQIHHIDGDPENNNTGNLATLCLEHHDMATMTIGLTKKITPDQVRSYKRSWEEKCAKDISALSRDRMNYYVTLYKNPQRIRELFVGLTEHARRKAVAEVAAWIEEEEPSKAADKAFDFQAHPKDDDVTTAMLTSLTRGEIWPKWLPRVRGHVLDPDLPDDMSPPNGMNAFHYHDVYCQLMVQVLAAHSRPIPLEDIYSLDDDAQRDAEAGKLISFRESVRGKGVKPPSLFNEYPTSLVTLTAKREGHSFGTRMALRTEYVFSSTAQMNLTSGRVCGIALFGGAETDAPTKTRMQAVPMLIGVGGVGQSDGSGGWDLK